MTVYGMAASLAFCSVGLWEKYLGYYLVEWKASAMVGTRALKMVELSVEMMVAYLAISRVGNWVASMVT